MSYLLPSGETTLDGACTLADGLCAWAGRAAYRWDGSAGWTALSAPPAAIDSAFELRSGVLAGAGSQVGFLPADASDWAGWVDLSSTFSDAHPMYGDLLFCTDQREETYVLFEVSASGLDPLSQFSTDKLSTPVAGWSPPTTPERLLFLGEDGLWALDPPYSTTELQHLVSFDGVDMPPLEEIPDPFQPGAATVVVPRRSQSALRLDLSDGTGEATGLTHVPGGGALWSAYLRDNRTLASRLLATLAALPAPPSGPGLQLHAALHDPDTDTVRAVATSAGLWQPGADPAPGRAAALRDAPFDRSTLATWALWLDWDGALDDACRRLCTAAAPDYALAESLRTFAGLEAVRALFDLLRSPDPPAGPEGTYRYPAAALRALVAPFGPEAAPLVASGLTASSPPLRVAACTAAGADARDIGADDGADASNGTATPALWTDAHPLPVDALQANLHHDHPSVRAAARDACARLSIEARPPAQAP